MFSSARVLVWYDSWRVVTLSVPCFPQMEALSTPTENGSLDPPQTCKNENDSQKPKSIFKRLILRKLARETARYSAHLPRYLLPPWTARNTTEIVFSRLSRCEPHVWTQQGAPLLNAKSATLMCMCVYIWCTYPIRLILHPGFASSVLSF